MKFQKGEQLPVIICSDPGKFKTACSGFLAVLVRRNLLLNWGSEITEYNIKLKKGRKVLDKIRITLSLFLSFIFFGLLSFFLYRDLEVISFFTSDFWFGSGNYLVALFLISIFFFCYFIYRTMVFGKKAGKVESYNYKKKLEFEKQEFSNLTSSDWSIVDKFKKTQQKDISKSFTEDALDVLGKVYLTAKNKKSVEVNSEYLFMGLLDSKLVSSSMLRLEVPTKFFKEQYQDLLLTPGKSVHLPEFREDFYQIIFKAYELAFKNGQKYVGVLDLLVCTLEQSERLQEILYDLKIDSDKLENVTAWFSLREKLREEYKELKKAGSFRSKHGIDRAMTAVSTPYLNRFSEDLTAMAKYGAIAPCIGRKKEFEEIFRVVDSGRSSILLVGDYGVGKRTLVEGLARKMIENNVPERLFDKRLVKISMSSLTAGTTPSGAKERVLTIMSEVARAGNVILFLENLDELLNTEASELANEVANSLSEHLSGGSILTFATSTNSGYKKFISGSNLSSVFETVDIKELDNNQAIQVVESKIGGVESKNKVFFSYSAIEQSVVLARKFINNKSLPGSALEIVNEAGSYVHSKPNSQLVTEEDIGYIIKSKTGIPAVSVTSEEKSKLMNLGDEMHKRVIGQDDAVELVANALKRARAGMRSEKKPISVFLFLGPTGVGKTELAKTIANNYFGSENNMIRIDMSEYQEPNSIYRLIGQPEKQGTGILTEAVMKQPFSLVLLDELEKAHKDVLNLFLQVFDDGRLTDSVGRTVDFTNTIIISTSNAGTAFAQEQLNSGVEVEEVRQKMMRNELREYFAPEFLNRFDAIVLFKTLEKEEIKQIASLMLKQVGVQLEEKGFEFKVESIALEELADIGYDPDFGARPMRRAIQDNVENKLADLFLEDKLNRGDVVILGRGLELEIK
ncbi:MAG: ATP-dependent Clp protease ATP-binding subunit [Candidatus Magasanikbacteria bacterium]|nr:ATP-dependent Clp protease ATP-binding subunit [Candidatus Magasanikbacteria bacterium]